MITVAVTESRDGEVTRGCIVVSIAKLFALVRDLRTQIAVIKMRIRTPAPTAPPIIAGTKFVEALGAFETTGETSEGRSDACKATQEERTDTH